MEDQLDRKLLTKAAETISRESGSAVSEDEMKGYR
jgi:hypothetical protein